MPWQTLDLQAAGPRGGLAVQVNLDLAPRLYLEGRRPMFDDALQVRLIVGGAHQPVAKVHQRRRVLNDGDVQRPVGGIGSPASQEAQHRMQRHV